MGNHQGGKVKDLYLICMGYYSVLKICRQSNSDGPTGTKVAGFLWGSIGGVLKTHPFIEVQPRPKVMPQQFLNITATDTLFPASGSLKL